MTLFRPLAAAAAFFFTALAAYAIIDPALQMQTGNPSGATADPANHGRYLIQRPQYALDYDDTTRQPNWVAWNYTTSDTGSAGRSPVFFQDTTLPAGFYQVLTTDYSGSGYDRGHMTPSGDRTVTRADNDATFYMSNMIPQAPDNNQGVWANFENHTRSLAAAGHEILLISGPSLFGGSTIASGVAIPGFTWKIALVVPLGSGTALSRITASTRIITIKVPNTAGVRSTPWESFRTSVAQIEADTGYTFLTALDPGIRATLRLVVDGQTVTGAPGIVAQPVAQSAPVGGTATFSVIATGDAPLGYQWLKDEAEIAGATSATLTLANVQASDIATYTVAVTNNVGAVTSNGAALVVSGLPPTITTQPVSRVAAAGTNVSFTVASGGSAPFTYQWRKGGLSLSDLGNVSGSATPTLTLSNVQDADVAGYDVVVTNSVNSALSNSATLTVTPAAPTIASQPANRSLAPGSTATFSVVAVGSAPLGFQWRKGGAPISGNASAATATLILPGITLADAGNYDVVVTNIAGSATSAVASLSISSASATQIFYTGGAYLQDFDTLPGSGSYAISGTQGTIVALATAPINAAGLGGWSFSKHAGGIAAPVFAVGTGSGTAGGVYSFGVSGVNVLGERALGALGSGSNASRFGATLVNNTGQTISQFTLSYAGEQWRHGGATTASTLAFSYAVNPADLNTGAFTNVPALNFVGLSTSTTAAFLDGNASANRTAISSTVTGLSWGPGQTLVIRWTDVDDAGSDDGLAIDNVSFSTPITGPVGPTVVSSTPADLSTHVALNAPIAITFDQAVSVSGPWFTINSATRGALAAAVTASGDAKTYTLTLPSNFDFSEAITVTVLASGVSSQSTGLRPAANYGFSFVTAPPIAPSITTPPVAQTVAAGGSASFTVEVSGTAPFTYQWRKGGFAIAGNPTAATATLVLSNVQAADIASYDVVVSNGVGAPVTSAAASLSVTPTAPTIVTQPVGQNVAAGGTVVLSVAVTGSTPFTYQWRKGGIALSDGVVVAGSATPTLTLTGATVLNSGSYDVVISNGVGSPVTSTAVPVLVIAPPSVINYSGGTYAQNFDTLPAAGTFTFTGVGPFSLDANPGVNAPGLAGWSMAKSTGSGPNVLFRFDDGAGTAGSIVSYGVAGAADWALGSLGSGTFAGRVGVTLVNTSGHTINYVTVSYTGEQWRYAGSTAANRLTFAYSVGSADISTGTFTAANALDFNPPITTGSTTKLDGNLAANRVPNLTATLAALNWAPGQTLVLRWSDADDSGADSALAIDDFSLTDAPPVPTITTQPVAQTVPAFSPVSFTVAATSNTVQSFQWRKGGTPLTGNATATTATLLLASATAADAGSYDCVVTNAFGSTTSAAAALSIIKLPASVALGDLAPTYDGSPRAATVTTAPAGLSVAITYDGSAAAPTDAGSYAVVATIADPNYVGAATGTLVIAKAPATVALAGLSATYNGTPRVVTATTIPAGLATAVTYDGSAAAPTNAGTYAVAASIIDPNYSGSAAGSLTVDKALAPVVLGNLNQVYDGTPKSVTAATTPVGLTVNLTYNSTPTAPTAAGSYAVVASVANANYRGSTSATLVIAPATVTVALSGLTQAYDGTPKPVTATTTPVGLAVSITYDGSATAPTYPGTYAVVATITDPNYTGTASGSLVITVTALVRRAPSLDGGLDGSLQVLTGESFALNGNAYVSGDLLVPGLPQVRLNGRPTFVGTRDGTGSATPSNYQVTLNGNAVLRYLVRRTDPLALPAVAAPPAPTGTRNVALNSANASAGDFATIRDLTLNGNAGNRAIPAGTYGTFVANGNSGFVLGVAGATTSAIYNLQGLTLNGNAQVQIVGPVVIVLASGVSIDGPIGAAHNPAWLTLAVASGGVTLNGNTVMRGTILAPNGSVTINGNATLTGTVAADRLTINGNGLLQQPTP